MGRKRPRRQKCLPCGRLLSATGQCSRCDATEDPISDPGVFEVSILSPPEEVASSIFPNERTCYSCHRISTESFPLEFEAVAGNTIVNRKKLGPSKTSSNITLCQLCSAFVNPSNPSYNKIAAFKFAWPAVFWKMLTDEDITCNFWQYIPFSLRSSWLNKTACENLVFWSRMDMVSVPVFTDISERLRKFNAFKQEMPLAEMVNSVNEEFFPCVKCPVGCEEFIDECGQIDFTHYLGKIIPTFSQFNTKPMVYLRGIRTDYELTDFIFPEDPLAPSKKPTLLFNDNGVFLLTCRDHNNKIDKQYLHLPRHPAGRIFNPLSDRFAPAILSTRTMKPFRENFSTASYKMVKLQSSFAGLNTCFLSESRSFDKVNDESVAHESFYLHMRKDTELVLRKLVKNGHLSQGVGDSILQNKNFDWIEKAAIFENHTNFLPLETVGFLRYVRNLQVVEPLTVIEEVDEVEGDDISSESEVSHESIGEDPTELSDCRFQEPESCSFSTSSNNELCSLDKLHFPCVKVMDKSLGAPPTTYVVGSEQSKIIFDLTANSVLFMSNIIQGHLRKQRFSSKILECFWRKKRKSFKQSFNDALRKIERDLEESTLFQTLHRLPFVKCVEVQNRQQPIDFNIEMADEHDFVALISSCSRNRSLLPPNDCIETNGGTFKLTYILSDDSTTKVFFRHKVCEDWWNITTVSRPEKVTQQSHWSFLPKNNWKICVYERLQSSLDEKERSQNVCSVFGQDMVFCDAHRLPLACDFPKNSFFCQFDEFCTRKSAWRCPSDGCESALCRKHLSEIHEESAVTPHVGKNEVLRQQVESDETEVDSGEDESEVEASTSEIDAPTDAGVVEAVEVSETDAGAEAVQMHSARDLKTVGSHVILNAVCSLLNRPRNPTYFRKKEWRFLQSFIAKCPGESVPLTFPEAMLLPSIYYLTIKNSICGAIPSPLFAPAFVTNRFNFADIISHIRSRLKNLSLLTSCDPRVIQFYFDCFLNFQVQRFDSRFVLNRGLEELGSLNCERSQAIERMNEEDSRKIVNELASAIRSEEPTFFLTFTLNQSRMFGVAPLYKLIERNTVTMSEPERRNVKEGFMPLYMRLWERAATFFIRYLERSKDKPLGTVKNIFPRFEFQTSKGNAPHLHVIIWTYEDKNNPTIRNKVVGSFRQLLHELKIELADPTNTMVNSEEDVDDLHDLAKTTLTHSCERGNYRCHKKCDNSGRTICRFKVYEPCSETFFKLIDRPHCEDVWEILRSLHLAHLLEGHCEVAQELKAVNYNYAADFGETFSPVVTKIFSLIQGSMNCLICDAIMSATYLAKYAAGVEEHATVKIHGQSSESVSVSVKKMKNIKIAGAKIAAEKEKNTSTSEVCRILSSTECIWSMLDLKYVFPTYTCVHVNTLPLENRSCFKRRTKYKRFIDRSGQNDQDYNFVRFRKTIHLPQNRLFSKNQKKTLREYINSGLTIDKVSLFALRPPELLFVNDLEIYFRNFSFEKIRFPELQNLLSENLETSSWIDATGNLIRLRPGGTEDFLEFLSESCQSPNRNYAQLAAHYQNVFRSGNCSHLFDGRTSEAKPLVVVFPNTLPRHIPNFLISLLLQFGRFETEFDLYQGGTLPLAFEKAGLVSDANSITDTEINAILKRFVLKRVVYIPGSHISQDRQIVDAKVALSTLSNNNDVLETPTIVYTALQEECTKELLESLRQKLSNVSTQIHELVFDTGKPPVEQVLDCNLDTPLQYNPMQSPNVVFNDEQLVVLLELMKTIDEYKNFTAVFFKHRFVVGMPGSGKTFIITNALLYALCQGLNVMVTSLSSERAMQFAGMHIHDLFCLPVSSSLNVDTIVQKSMQKLKNDIFKQSLIKRIDILYFEEIGMVSAEEFAAIDYILQKTRESFAPFGGILIVGTGDPKQLPPPQGRLIWTSPIILSSVRMFALKKCVRMTDFIGRQFLEMLSVPKISESEVEQILKTFDENCNFCDFDSSPIDAVRIFGTRAAEWRAIDAQIERVSTSGRVVTRIPSVDEVKVNCTSNWNAAPANIKRALNRVCLEPEVLYCYKNALLRLTVNMPALNVSQGQMCVFKNFDGHKKIDVIVAPPGVRKLPPKNSQGMYMFYENGWFDVSLYKQSGFVNNFHGSSIRRTQFPLKNFMAMTIHKAMGETIGKIITKIDCFEREYCLWEREQLYVLVSRVQNLGDITFLGDKHVTLEAIRRLLKQSSQWDEFTERLVNTASNQPSTSLNLANLSPFTPRKIELPPGEVGFVYLLVSTKDATSTYVGQTSDLRRRLREHNSGSGSYLTNQIHLRPWGVLCFATGFSDLTDINRSERIDLEEKIHSELFTSFNARNRQGSAAEVLELFLRCVEDNKKSIAGLRAVVTGKIIS